MEVKVRTARSLVRRLKSAASSSSSDGDGGDEASVAAALSEIRLISKHDPEIRALLADAGAIPLLAAQLVAPSPSAAATEDAAAALLNLSISAREALMSTPGILDALGAALRHPAPAAATQHAAAALFSLLAVDAYRPIIGSKRPLLASLLALLRPPAPTRSIKDALKALFGVALYPLNRPALVDLGAVPALFSLVVKDGRGGVVEDATAVIAQVAGCAESVDAFRRVAGVRVLVDLVDPATGATGRARENAAAALLNLVMAGGEKAAGDVREIEGAEALVRQLAEGGAARGKAKAEALLRELERARASGRRRLVDLFDESDIFSRRTTSSSSSVSEEPSKVSSNCA